MQNKRDITLDIKTVYQILIGDLRYGYTRNNHLMPSDAYDKAKSILNLMKKTNSTWAYSTANQICEECISDQIMIHFYNGFDEAYDYLLSDILGTTNGTFNNLNIVEQGRVIGKKFRILSPDNHHGELYMILRN